MPSHSKDNETSKKIANTQRVIYETHNKVFNSFVSLTGMRQNAAHPLTQR